MAMAVGSGACLAVLLLMAGMAAAQVQVQAVPSDCTRYVINHPIFRNLQIPCLRGRVFSAARTACVAIDDPANDQCPQARTLDDISTLCAQCPTCVYPHAEKCNAFYNCSRTARSLADVLAPLEDECEFPNQFDKVTLTCRHYSQVDCDSREEVKYQCGYRRKTCEGARSAHCRPCSATYADCRDLADGYQVWQGRDWSPYFALCQDGRSLQSSTCATARDGTPRIFSPVTRDCEDIANIPRAFGGQA